MGNTFHAALIKICSNELIVGPSKSISKEDFATGKKLLRFKFRIRNMVCKFTGGQ